MDMICRNIINGLCNKNVHNIIEKMGQNRFRENFVGGLFSGLTYSVFEGEDCIQYLQEYVPFHLPQIEYVLREVYVPEGMGESRYFANPTINIMDVGSGPATVPLAFCRLIPKYIHKHRFKITTVEASEGFNNMINVFKATNTNESVEIVNNLKYNILDDNFINDESPFKIGYNWIIIANSISAIGQGRSNHDVNKILNNFISNVLYYSDKVLLTIIEGSLKQYFDIPTYLSEIEKIGFDDLKIMKTVSSIDCQEEFQYIAYCKFYKTKYPDYYKPHINSKSLLLELK